MSDAQGRGQALPPTRLPARSLEHRSGWGMLIPRPSALGPSSHPHTGPGTLQGHRGWGPRGYVSALASPRRPPPCPQGQLTARNLPLAFCLESWFSEALKALAASVSRCVWDSPRRADGLPEPGAGSLVGPPCAFQPSRPGADPEPNTRTRTAASAPRRGQGEAG